MQDASASLLQRKSSTVFYGWWLVLVSAIGIMLSCGSVLTFTFGVFILPLNQEFGWSRTELSLGYSLSALFSGAFQPLIGKLIDRFSARKVILPSIVFVGLVMTSGSATPSPPIVMTASWARESVERPRSKPVAPMTSSAGPSPASAWAPR